MIVFECTRICVSLLPHVSCVLKYVSFVFCLSHAHNLTLYLPIFLFEYVSVRICVSCLPHVCCCKAHTHSHSNFSLSFFLVVFERNVYICVFLLTHICYVKKNIHLCALSLSHTLSHTLSLPLFAIMHRMVRCTSFQLFITYYCSKHHNMQVPRCVLYNTR